MPDPQRSREQNPQGASRPGDPMSGDRRTAGEKSQAALLHDQLVTAERSVFGTRLPRPTGVGRHLFVVIVLSVVALGIAIYFAEREAPAASGAAPADARFAR